MSDIKPRPSLINYDSIPTPTGVLDKINRLEVYRTQRKWYEFWKPKRITHTLALTDNGIYEIFPPDHKIHEPLFGGGIPEKETKQ